MKPAYTCQHHRLAAVVQIGCGPHLLQLVNRMVFLDSWKLTFKKTGNAAGTMVLAILVG